MKWQTTPVILAGESHGQRSLVGYCPWGHKESDMTEYLHTATPKMVGFLHINELTRYLKFLLLAIKYCCRQLEDRGQGPHTQECESLEPEKSS